jgi:polyhydroxyalkanoate synthesis regulator phasin
VLDFTTFANLLLRSAESARDDARRILDELRERGDLSAEEARAFEEAVGRAAVAGHGLLRDALAAPLRRALSMLRSVGAAGEESDPGEPVASFDERLAALEARLDALAAQRNE